MNSFEDKSNNDIAESIIDSFREGSKYNVFSLGSNSKRKIQVRRLLKQISNSPFLIFLEQKKRETQSWEIVFADVTVIKKGDLDKDEYKYIGFDIHADLTKGRVYKSLFISFSFHALKRIIERCNIKELSTPTKVKSFLSSMLKPILLRCISMYEEMNDDFSNNLSTSKDELLRKRETYIVNNNLFMPMVMEVGINTFGKISFSFTIKTVMPSTYNGAKRTIREQKLREIKENILDYSDLLSTLAQDE